MRSLRVFALLIFIWAVGLDSVLSVADGREMRCGRRLVSGLFSRQRLPLGYSYVTTVPRGACRLNVTEIMPSDNYIAIKVTNGTYIINGEFAISAPGTYDAVGVRFIYSRILGLDSIFAHGPLHYPIDIMILYTEPNPNIKYEYFTEALPGDTEIDSITKSTNPEDQATTAKHTRRHHNTYSKFGLVNKHSEVSKDASLENNLIENVVGARRFVWKITSYTTCTRSCGGGIQIGKYRCIEENADGVDREISPVHCTGSAPTGRRRRCGNIPCPPRWRAAAWSSCPQCGPATRQRIVGCVQDHSKGIIKVSDQMCPSPKPATTENCQVPDCNGHKSGEVRPIETKRPSDHTDAFREGPVYTITVNSSDIDVGPEYSVSATAAWLQADWSECVGWCVGGGVQTRSVRCGDPSGCPPQKLPEQSKSCTPRITCEAHHGQWFTVHQQLLLWYRVQRRTVVCARGSHGAKDAECEAPRPAAQRPCDPQCTNKPTEVSKPLTETTKQGYEIVSTTKSVLKETELRVCEDKLNNCALAVQARLCHYNYYILNCCNSCKSLF